MIVKDLNESLLLWLLLCQISIVSGGGRRLANNPEEEEMGFRLSTVDRELVRCMRGDDIELDAYLAAFREICKIFKEMGSVFNFVTTDLEDKIQILEEYLLNDNAENFKTLNTMIEYETQSGALGVRWPPSGSRTLLRLHRALQFVSLFFSRLATVDFENKMTSLAQDCYEQTLAKYHGFFIRKGAIFAMYALPTVDAMFARALDDRNDVRQLLHSVGENAQRVYEITQKRYDSGGLLSLP